IAKDRDNPVSKEIIELVRVAQIAGIDAGEVANNIANPDNLRPKVKGYIQVKVRGIIIKQMGNKIKGQPNEVDLRNEIQRLMLDEPALEDWLDIMDRNEIVNSLMLDQDFLTNAELQNAIENNRDYRPDRVINSAVESARRELQ